jgi:sugar lactone lactonase YvrE
MVIADPPVATPPVARHGRRAGRPRLVPLTALAALSVGVVLAAAVGASAADPVPGQLSVVAGNGGSGAPSPGPATRSKLNGPFGVAIDGLGNVYIADSSNDEVEKVSPTGTLSVVAGTGTAGPATPGPATESDLDFPTKVAVDGLGNLYIADDGNNEVEKVSPTGVLSVIAGTGTAGPSTPGPATSSDLQFPYGVAVDASGDVYIADSANDEIDEVSPAGVLSVIAGTGTAGVPTAGPATASDLDFPSAVAVDGLGDVFIADTFNSEVEEVSAAHVLSIVAGTGANGAPTPGPATSSDLQAPYGVAVDASGNVYVADTFNNVIEKVTAGVLSVIAGTGTAGRITPGPALSSDLKKPDGLAVGALGDIDASLLNNDEVVRVTSSQSSTVGLAAVGSGYLSATSAGRVINSDTTFYGSPQSAGVKLGSSLVGVAAEAAGGYVVATSAGNVYNYGTSFLGSPVSAHVTLASPVVGVAAAAGGGYLVATSAGSVYNYGTSSDGTPRSAGVSLTTPVVGIAAPPAGGYVVATASGSIYNYGTPFHGSPHADGVSLASPVVAVAAADGGGYLVATAAGSVYNYGTAFRGSPHASGIQLTSPVVGITAVASGGYLLTTAAGTVYRYPPS